AAHLRQVLECDVPAGRLHGRRDEHGDGRLPEDPQLRRLAVARWRHGDLFRAHRGVPERNASRGRRSESLLLDRADDRRREQRGGERRGLHQVLPRAAERGPDQDVHRPVRRRVCQGPRPDRDAHGREAVRRAHREPELGVQGDPRLPVSDRAARWFYGLPNLVGAGLAVLGLGAFIGGVLHGWLVIPIVAGLYALGALVTPRPKGLTGLMSPDGSLDAGRLRSSLEKLTRESADRLPPDLAAKVSQISQTIL